MYFYGTSEPNIICCNNDYVKKDMLSFFALQLFRAVEHFYRTNPMSNSRCNLHDCTNTAGKTVQHNQPDMSQVKISSQLV